MGKHSGPRPMPKALPSRMTCRVDPVPGGPQTGLRLRPAAVGGLGARRATMQHAQFVSRVR
jgi:hypothetical protein